ncbi:MAG: YIP1 family protein [Methanophagales archaeon]|nr:YIP1 family protein [Methanophagales archaeon]
MLSVLANPGKFFEERMKNEVRLGIPAIIVLLSGAVGGVSAFLMTSKTMEIFSRMMPAGAGGVFASVMALGSVIGAIVFSLLFWLIITAIFYGISAIFGGEGSFKRTLEFVGYGYIPTIFAGIIVAALTYHLVSTLTPPHIPAGAEPMEVSRIVQAWAQGLKRHPISMLSSAVGILFTLWSANIWIFAVKHARGLTTRNALLTVGIPVGAYIAYSLCQLLLA